MLRGGIVSGQRLRAAAALSSGVLLATAFPPLEWAAAAWFALVPLVIALRHATRAEGFRLGYLAGLIFWLLTVSSVLRLKDTGAPFLVAVAGWLTLAAYCSLYFGLFSMIVQRWFEKTGDDRWFLNLAFMLVGTAIWIGTEYLRSELFSGFPMNTVGVSQYRRLIICQVAEWGGVYAVSAVVVVFNMGLAFTAMKWRGVRMGKYSMHPEFMFALILLAVCLRTGMLALLKQRDTGTTFRVGAVQPNIPQLKKGAEEWIPVICRRLDAGTRSAATSGVDLVVWPETALPAVALRDPDCLAFIKRLLTNGVPILAGSIDCRWGKGERVDIFNSSILFEPSGKPPQIYDKQHLVPFGEYIPLESIFPSLERLSPLGWSCKPGKTGTVFELERPAAEPVRFGVLICFEDTVAALARRAVGGEDGARLLIDQSNDAWFDRTHGPRQHMTHCVLRCIENRVPAVRVTNTGITCVIDRVGRVTELAGGGYGAEQVLAAAVDLPPADMPLTFYTHHGDMFALPCGILAGLSFILVVAGRIPLKSRT